jgi:hypothetical protein
MKSPNIADLRMPSGSQLTPAWFDLENYDLDDWAQPGPEETMRVSRPDDNDLAPLDFA